MIQEVISLSQELDTLLNSYEMGVISKDELEVKRLELYQKLSECQAKNKAT
ncbi:MAG TPA: Spo0E family sporulation regulatory protein-aspartic acid phosphatase [Candidatus Nitrosocosmicus sp.]|nr:Spo0E family sporulation regulatory protein-aspartic acid phosphatase [Candidatus Nitrosocosmicus sp.]